MALRWSIKTSALSPLKSNPCLQKFKQLSNERIILIVLREQHFGFVVFFFFFCS